MGLRCWGLLEESDAENTRAVQAPFSRRPAPTAVRKTRARRSNRAMRCRLPVCGAVAMGVAERRGADEHAMSRLLLMVRVHRSGRTGGER